MSASSRCLHAAVGRLALLATLSSAAPSVLADVRLPHIFGSHMVLQQDQPIPVWGWAAPGESVTVAIGPNQQTTKANDEGRWKVTLPALFAGGPLVMTVEGRNRVTFEDVLVGEVWLASGQSNMQWPLSATDHADQEIAAADFPAIRLFYVPRKTAGMPADDVDAEWKVCTPENTKEFSAVAYHFGRELHTALGRIPVGLINSSWGGTRIEPWTPLVGFSAVPKLATIQRQLELCLPSEARHQESLSAYLRTIEQWLPDARGALSGQTLVPPMPPFPEELLAMTGVTQPSAIYHAMICPIVPYALRGAIWYQGESNRPEGMMYYEKMKALIGGWRQIWGQGDFPFYFVQLAPYTYGGGKETLLPKLWEAQTAALDIRNTGMAIINDIGNLTDIHPRNKREVGRRLSLWALAKTYQKDVPVYSGPLFRELERDGNRLRVRFDHTGSGLTTRDGQAPNWFEIAGKDVKYVKANAVIEDDTVVVSSPAVPEPTCVRFAWDERAEPNLMNRDGLPASSFRAGEPPIHNELEDRISAARGYRQVYTLDIPNEANFGDQPVPYQLDAREEVDGSIDRIAYYLELQERGGDLQYVFVSMEAFTQDPAKIGVPTASTGVVLQQEVQDLEVVSNVPGIPQGEHRTGGNIEFWASNYGPENARRVRNASSSTYDFGDSNGSANKGYGSMQIHDHEARVTLFAYNRWGSGGPSDLGIGNAPSGNPDWTFAGNAGNYTTKRLIVLARPVSP